MYCTRFDLVARFGSREVDDLLDRNNDQADDSQTLALTVADTDALIDGYLAARYAVPLSPVPQVVTALACDIVRLKLWDDHAPEEVRKRYDDALKVLTNYSKGVMVLVGAMGAVLPESTLSSGGGIEFYAPERVFKFPPTPF